MILKQKYLANISTIAFTCVITTSPVMGQSQISEVPGQASAASIAQGQPSTNVNDAIGVADIVVTAQRFAESAQKTALAISVINSDELAGISHVGQLQTVEPGVQIAGTSITQTFIRGVGSATVIAGQEAAIAYNIDGVYIYSSTMITPQMYDLERIEVLKGPQGTLYGRNASGGVINLITAGAKLGKAEGHFEAEFGNYARRRVEASGNMPLSDTFAIRLAGQHVEHSGYLSDGTDDQNLSSARLRARWEPSSSVVLQLGADVSHQGGRGPGYSISPNPTDDKWLGTIDPRAQTGLSLVNGGSSLRTTQTDEPFLDNNQWSVNAQLDVDLGFATLTVLPAYRNEKGRYLEYPAFANNQDFFVKERTFEARLANRSDALKWVVGGYYLDTKSGGVSTIRQELIGVAQTASQRFHVKSYAFFGEATYSLTDAFRLIGGLRYTHEETKFSGDNNSTFAPFTPAMNPFDPITNPTGEVGDFVSSGTASANAVTWKAGAEFDVFPNSFVFATASRGFKGGGLFQNFTGDPNSFKPEYLTAFEFGSRNRFLNNRLQINAGLFYWKLKDQQQTYLLNGRFGPVNATLNAGKAHIYGGNVDVVLKPTPNDTISGHVEYNKSKYDSFTREVPSFALLDLGGTACDITPGPVTAIVDCTDLELSRTPKWTAAARYEHRFDLGNSGNITFDADMTYGSSRYLTINYVEVSRQKGYALFNAGLNYETADGSITVSAWIRNIANTRVMSVGLETFTVTSSRVALLPPRTFGGSVRFSF